MKKAKMGRFWSLLFAVIFLAASCGLMTQCRWWEDYLPEYESDYYRYAVRSNKDGTKTGYIVGLTETGKEQKYLVVPDEIDGIKLVSFGYRRQTTWGSEQIGRLESEKLQKMYTPKLTADWSGYSCYGYFENAYLVQWKTLISSWVRVRFEAGEILAHTAAREYFDRSMNVGTYYNTDKLANLVYKLNYRGAPEEGYYWADSYDNSVAEFIPPAPTREGYTFAGWYKESACQNAWDFATDKTGDEIIILRDTILDDYDDREVTRLYAKWEQA